MKTILITIALTAIGMMFLLALAEDINAFTEDTQTGIAG